MNGMKNGLLIWNALLTLGIGYLLFAQFGGKKPVNSTTTGKDTAGGEKAAFKIAYFEMDSLASSFDMVKELKAEMYGDALVQA